MLTDLTKSAAVKWLLPSISGKPCVFFVGVNTVIAFFAFSYSVFGLFFGVVFKHNQILCIIAENMVFIGIKSIIRDVPLF